MSNHSIAIDLWVKPLRILLAAWRSNLSSFFCVYMVKSIAFVLHFRRHSPVHSLQRQDTDEAADIREPVAALSGISRASRFAIVSIQRHLACFPPVISAEIRHKLHQVLHLTKPKWMADNRELTAHFFGDGRT